MKKIKIVFIILLLFLMQSCLDLGLYISDFPLGPPGSSPPMPSLEGKWKKFSKSENETGIDYLEFVHFNENEYIIRSGDNNEKSLARAFITKISGSQFLNIQDLSEKEKQYVFCKFNISKDNIMTMHFIGDTIFKSRPPSTSKKLRRTIKKNINNPELFNNEMKFYFRKTEN